MDAPAQRPDLRELIALFFTDAQRLGSFAPVTSGQTPAEYRALLDHEHHMTVTVEQRHGTPVDVEVLAVQRCGDEYARMILLRRRTDRRVVQFGIVRLRVPLLAPPVWQEIESQRTPLGRVLIEHGVLRRIRLSGLWRVSPGPDLAHWFAAEGDPADASTTYGRTAVIECDGEPAIELLEIVTAEPGVLQ